MLVYLVGMWTFVDETETPDPYYYGYTTNPQIAHIYYDMLIERAKKEQPSNTVVDMYFIREISYSKFTEDDKYKYVDEIDEYPGGVYMTASDFEYLADSVSGHYDDIIHSMETGDFNLFIKKIQKYAKYSKKKRLKKAIDKFIDASNDLYESFNDLEDACDGIKWDKAMRKFW